MQLPLQIKVTRKSKVYILIISLLLFIAAFILWYLRTPDEFIIISNNIFFNYKGLVIFAEGISRAGTAIIALIYVFLIFIYNKGKGEEQDCLLFIIVLLAFAIGTLLGAGFNEIIGRPGPVASLGYLIKQIDLTGSPSFPSGQATKSMALAIPFVLLARQKTRIVSLLKRLLFILVLLIGLSGLILQRYFLSDLLAGWGVALISLLPAVIVTNYIFRKRFMNPEKLRNLNECLWFVFIGITILLYLI